MKWKNEKCKHLVHKRGKSKWLVNKTMVNFTNNQKNANVNTSEA